MRCCRSPFRPSKAAFKRRRQSRRETPRGRGTPPGAYEAVPPGGWLPHLRLQCGEDPSDSIGSNAGALRVQQRSKTAAIGSTNREHKSLTEGFWTFGNHHPPATAVPSTLQPPSSVTLAIIPPPRARLPSATAAALTALQPPTLASSAILKTRSVPVPIDGAKK